MFPSLDPRTGTVLDVYPVTSASEVADTVAQMQERAGQWVQSTLQTRVRAIRQLCDGIAADSDHLAKQVCREIGKPMQDALASDLLALVQALEWLAKHLEEEEPLAWRTVPGEPWAILQPVPYGVVGVIGTWNYPLLLDGTTIAWALAAGNGVVWKPSELATGCARALLPHFQRAGLPVEMVTGGGEVGQALCDTPLGKLAFTGGVSTGRAIMAQLAPRGIPAVMELSGNDALILCDSKQPSIQTRKDAKRLEAAARAAVWARVCNAGQSCVSPQRVYAIGATYEPFVAQCRQIMASLRTGIDYGPMRTEALRQRVHLLVQEAIEQGATLHVGGKPLCATAQELPNADLGGGANGFFYAPTLLTDVQEDLPIQQQDFFGPVLCVQAVESEEEAIALANANPMALGASVWTDDVSNGKRIAARLRAGVVTINSETLLTGAHPALPFGGMGASGFGRQRGAAGLEEFVQWKTVLWQSTASAQRHVFPYREPTLPILRGLLALKTARTFRKKLEAMWQCADAAMKWK